MHSLGKISAISYVTLLRRSSPQSDGTVSGAKIPLSVKFHILVSYFTLFLSLIVCGCVGGDDDSNTPLTPGGRACTSQAFNENIDIRSDNRWYGVTYQEPSVIKAFAI